MEPITLAQAIRRIGPADARARRRAEARQRSLTKPPGSLGRLEEVSVQLAGIFATEKPRIRGKAVIVAAADHGVVAQGVTGYPQAVTGQMVQNFLDGGGRSASFPGCSAFDRSSWTPGWRAISRTIPISTAWAPDGARATSLRDPPCPPGRRSSVSQRG